MSDRESMRRSHSGDVTSNYLRNSVVRQPGYQNPSLSEKMILACVESEALQPLSLVA